MKMCITFTYRDSKLLRVVKIIHMERYVSSPGNVQQNANLMGEKRTRAVAVNGDNGNMLWRTGVERDQEELHVSMKPLWGKQSLKTIWGHYSNSHLPAVFTKSHRPGYFTRLYKALRSSCLCQSDIKVSFLDVSWEVFLSWKRIRDFGWEKKYILTFLISSWHLTFLQLWIQTINHSRTSTSCDSVTKKNHRAFPTSLQPSQLLLVYWKVIYGYLYVEFTDNILLVLDIISVLIKTNILYCTFGL